MRIGSGIDWAAGSWERICQRHSWDIPERLNIAAIACDGHADGRGRTALVSIDEDGKQARHTFDELRSSSNRLASLLAGAGVERGDRVAVLLPQRLETALAHLASFKLAAISVPLSPLFRVDALEYRLRHSGAKVVITDREHLPALPSPPIAGLRVLACEELPALLRGADPDRPPADTRSDDPAMLIYTSGTSGLPKGALHAHRFVPGRLTGFELIHRLESRSAGDRPFWTPADWAWVGGLVDCVLTPWVFGCPVLAWPRRGFQPEAILDLVSRARVRSLFLPPTAIRMLRAIEDPRERWPLDVLSVHTAGEPLGALDWAWAERTFGNVFELYGMTEVGATIGNCPLFPVRPGSMGKPFPGHTIALLDEHGDRARTGELGEIAVHRDDPGMFLEYFGDPEATQARFKGQYLVSGDLARFDEDGYLYFEGRADDVFNTSGHRVGPTEIETTLESHPAVVRAAAVGEPDALRGHAVKAFILLRDGFLPSAALYSEIQEHVRNRLALYEVPRRIVFARELPTTASGKIRRAELRAPDAEDRWGLAAGASTAV